MKRNRTSSERIDLTELQLASSGTARVINRAIVLELIRAAQPISRAEISRRSGLGRSTVSQIVEQLIQEEWVREGLMGSLPRGRRPTMVGLNENLVAIAVDLHPGQAGVAVVDLNGRLLSHSLVPLTSDPANSTASIAACIQRVRSTVPLKSVRGIGISVSGRINPATQRLIFAPNLKWPEFDLRSVLEIETGLPVIIENDATACLFAELTFVRMDGVRDAALVAVSEGVGACVLANSQMVVGHNGMAGEFGHIPVDPGGPVCGCGQSGCWEVFSSNPAALRYFAELKPNSRSLSYKELLDLAEQGDAAAADALQKQAVSIGRGLRILIAATSPSMILIAGDLTSAWHRFGPIIEHEVAGLTLAGSPPRIQPTHEGEIARLRGAAALIFHHQDTTSAPPPLAPSVPVRSNIGVLA